MWAFVTGIIVVALLLIVATSVGFIIGTTCAEWTAEHKRELDDGTDDTGA